MSTDVTSLGDGVVQVNVEPAPITEISIEPAPIVEVQSFVGGITYSGTISLEYQLTLGRLLNQNPPSLYKEFTYSGDNLTEIRAWNNSSKDTYLLRIQLSYTGSNLTQKILTDQISGRVLTVTYGYTGDNLTSVNEVFS